MDPELDLEPNCTGVNGAVNSLFHICACVKVITFCLATKKCYSILDIHFLCLV